MITGSFMGLNLALSGMYSSQKALDLTSKNIANSATDGYSRRVAAFKIFGQDTAGVGDPGFGLGSDYMTNTRMRDDYLDTKVWNQSSIANEWDVKYDYYTKLEQIVNEPSNSSLTTNLDDFYLALQEFSKEPASTTKRYAVLRAGEQVTSYFNEVATKLEEFQQDLNESVKDQVDEINSLAKQLGELNQKIYNAEVMDSDTGTLKDQRCLLIDQLSQYGNVEITENTYGKFANGGDEKKMTITFGGTVLVDHSKTREITYSKSLTKANSTDVEGLYGICMAGGGRVDLTSGSLKATLDVRDGNGSNSADWVKGVPYYAEELNNIARTFAKAFNEGIIERDGVAGIDPNTEKTNGFADGYTFNSQVGDAKPGIRFFTSNSTSSANFINGATTLDDINNIYDGITAKNIGISSDLLNDIGNMFSSFTDPTNRNDADSIAILYSFKDDNQLFGTTNLEDHVAGMITNLGVDAETAKDLSESHDSIMLQLENRREGYSGVSINEETTNLIKFQQMYKASAKIVSVFSELYNVLVNTI